MSEWKAKRFWTSAQVVPSDDGFGIALDGRPVKTPAKQVLAVPTEAFADAIAREWDAQAEVIDPRSMPFTRTANVAIDKVVSQKAEVSKMLADYGDSDLLCYRADRPQELVQRQSDLWDPVLEWAAQTYGARLLPRIGVVHEPQSEIALSRLSEPVFAMSHFELAAFHDLVSLSGSLVLALACTQDLYDSGRIWDISRLDEIWQIEQWGADDDAEAVAHIKRAAFLHAKQVFDLLKVS
jgi:chaperone required for assembly of F1-ATPase